MHRKPSNKTDNQWQQAGLALIIPSMLAAGPIVGIGLGLLIQRWTGWGKWVMFVCITIGFISGVRETIKIIKRISVTKS